MNDELNETQYRKYLYEAQQKIKLRHQKLLEVIENLKRKGVQLPPDLPDLTKIEFKTIILDEYHDIPPSPVEVKESQKSSEAVGGEEDDIKIRKWTEMKEPVFDETELSDLGRLMVEAHSKGVPFKLPKAMKTPQSSDKTRIVKPSTPASGDSFMVKPIAKILPLQSNFRYRNRFQDAVVETSSPDLKTDSAFDYERSAHKTRLPLRWFSACKNVEAEPAETIDENRIKTAMVTSRVPSVLHMPMSVFDSPEELELENFKSTETKPTNILKSPESPELSEHFRTILERMKNKNLTTKSPDE